MYAAAWALFWKLCICSVCLELVLVPTSGDGNWEREPSECHENALRIKYRRPGPKTAVTRSFENNRESPNNVFVVFTAFLGGGVGGGDEGRGFAFQMVRFSG